MLIVAIPKSASTSLMVTLGRMHDIPSSQRFLQKRPVPEELKVLHRYHSDIRELGPGEVEGFDSSDQVFKQHIPPTAGNLDLLRSIKKVILLREPREIIEAYFRAESRKMHSPRPEFAGCQTLPDWHDRAEEIGLTGDLEWFLHDWTEQARQFPDLHLLVGHSDLIQSPTEVLNAIEDFFGLPQSQNVVLSKERYSRGPKGWLLLEQMKRNALRMLQRIRG